MSFRAIHIHVFTCAAAVYDSDQLLHCMPRRVTSVPMLSLLFAVRSCCRLTRDLHCSTRRRSIVIVRCIVYRKQPTRTHPATAQSASLHGLNARRFDQILTPLSVCVVMLSLLIVYLQNSCVICCRRVSVDDVKCV